LRPVPSFPTKWAETITPKQEVDGDEFERCAVDLLRDTYPNLRPLAGSDDAGQDGLFDLPDGRGGFPVSTTERDHRKNLWKSA